jgi:hypothetical protein
MHEPAINGSDCWSTAQITAIIVPFLKNHWYDAVDKCIFALLYP